MTTLEQYEASTARTRSQRMKWWHDARFGMFIHWGLYSQLGRHEWVMNRECIPVKEYEHLADSWKPRASAPREWAKLAKAAGMKYMVMTTKHHEGFCLWDTKQHDYNAAARGPGRDLVREYVEACRHAGLKVGLYYSLLDWHHPDASACIHDERARRRFVDFTHACVRELMSNYGRIDILWYDVPEPLKEAKGWESLELNRMVRSLQPHIIINNRCCLAEDFSTPEEKIVSSDAGRAWEACMTMNQSFGWQPCPDEDWTSVRDILTMLRTCAAGGGNLLLNVGPKTDGSLPELAVERLKETGRWLSRYGQAVYGGRDCLVDMSQMQTGGWTRKGKTLYYWVTRWPGRELAIGGLDRQPKAVRLLPANKPLSFEFSGRRLLIKGLPATCPDRLAQVGMIALDFDKLPRQMLGCDVNWGAAQTPPEATESKPSHPFVENWKASRLFPKSREGVAKAACISLEEDHHWQLVKASFEGFVSINHLTGTQDGIIYLANRFRVESKCRWLLLLGHDGGANLFVDGKSVLCEPARVNPAAPGRSRVELELDGGDHEIAVAFDTDKGMGWGIHFQFAVPEGQEEANPKGTLPQVMKTKILI
ncbi:MAG: alpha-L-fucosidase [Planctomycetes bacterium]|nr:alpha-L-fucosidase [Planctomycetota bacterium]